MSGHSISAIVVFISVTAIAIASQIADQRALTVRDPAMARKELILGETRGHDLKHTHKIRGPLEVTIELVGGTPEKAGDVFVIKGLVTSNEELRDVDFKWALPPGVELVNGSLSGTISILGPSRPADVQLTLKNITADNHQIHLIAKGQNNGIAFADSTQYNTLLEPMLKVSREELAQSTEKHAREVAAKGRSKARPKHNHGDLKVFH